VLDVPYAHMVFTLPHSLNGLYGAHPRWVIDTLFACVAQTLSEFAANPRWLGGQPAFTLVLHTWGQELQRHVHVHAVIACGALAANHDSGTDQWVQPTRSPEFLFPVTALSNVFRGKFMAALQAAHECGDIADDPQRGNVDWARRHQALYRHNWVVYAETPLGGPAQVLEYLAHYTHRTAISNERIVKITSDQVAFKVRADDKGGKRTVKFDGVEFVRRFLLHVLPTGLKRIRHYGLLAPSKAQLLAQARTQSADAAKQPRGTGVGARLYAPGGKGGPAPVSLLQAGTAARGGSHQGLQDVTGTGLADSDHAAQHGATMKAANGWIDGVLGVAGLHRQGEPCVQRRKVLALEVTPPGVARVNCQENGTVRQRLSAKRLNGTPAPDIQTYNPL